MARRPPCQFYLAGVGGMIQYAAKSEMGAVRAAPNVHIATQIDMRRTSMSYVLPAQYCKPIWYTVDDHSFATKGRRAFLLDLLIAAKPAGIDRTATWQAISNIGDTVKALRAKGLSIDTRRGQPAHYVLISDVCRIGGAQ
jgi:hypothetical protein